MSFLERSVRQAISEVDKATTLLARVKKILLEGDMERMATCGSGSDLIFCFGRLQRILGKVEILAEYEEPRKQG